MSASFGVLQPGTLFAADYRVVRPLATGGMGAVYVVSQQSTGKERALKLMRPELAVSVDARRRFLQEARVGGQIESEHIVEVHSAGVDEATGAPYLVMELLAGEDLASRIERAALPPREVHDVFEQICHAMGAAHDRAIVHRDLKPENVFLAQARRAGAERVNVKVLDFGIAKLLADVGTESTGMIGTPLWMAPEQADRGKVTPAADVWALSLMVYYALVGRLFWRSAEDAEATYTQLLKEIVLAPIPRPRERAREQGLADRVPDAIDAVLSHALARDPAARPPNARAFWTELARALADSSTASSSTHLLAAPSSGHVASIEALSATEAAAPSRRAHASSSLPRPNAADAPQASPEPSARFAPHLAAPLVSPPSPFAFRDLWTRAAAIWAGVFVLSGVASLSFLARGCTVRQHAAERYAQPIVRLPPTEGSRVMRLGESSEKTLVPAVMTCRLCSRDVLARGVLSRDQIVTALEADFARLDEECVAHGRPLVSAASVTLGFVVKNGVASNKRVLATTSKDGADQCLVRAIGDVRFPVTNEPTDVSYSLSFDPRVH